MSGSSFLPDVVPVEINGVISEVPPSQVAALFPSMATIMPTAPFSFSWNGSIVQFNIGDTQPIPADLLAALTAAGAPFTTP
jgi:hypothetical protein